MTTPDEQARRLRTVQWQAHRAIDILYRRLAVKADALLRANAEPRPFTGEPVLSDAGRERALLAIGLDLDRADKEAADIIARATVQAARLGEQP